MESRPILSFGTVIDNYTIIRCIGQGGFGDIYLVTANDTDQAFAMKVELKEARKQSLHQEASFLANLQGSPHFPHLITFNEDIRPRFIVQELLGPSLSSFRRNTPEGKFSMGSTLLIAQQMLRTLKEFHARGFIHNDVKPSNYLIRPNSENFLCLIDFGLSKAYIDPKTGQPIKVRQFGGFKGTKKYASPNAHLGFDLNIRDDMYSWFYSIIELSYGRLPWSNEKEKVPLIKGKKAIKTQPCFLNLPKRVQALYLEIEELGVFAQPDYDRWINEIELSFEEEGIEKPKRFEWECLETADEMRVSPIPLRLKPGKFAIEPDFYQFMITEEGKITVGIAEGKLKPKKFHPVSTVCNIA